MNINKGTDVYLKLLYDGQIYRGTVNSSQDNHIAIKLKRDVLKQVTKGDYMTITHNDNEFYAEIESYEANIIKANILWSEKREYFRVDDAMPIIVKKIKNTEQCRRSRIFSGYGTTVQNELTPDETINPVLWKMLLDIQSKLGLIIERMSPDSQSLLGVENKHVNISAAGICLILDEKFSTKDIVEVKMLLPGYPPVGILTYGKVVRAIDMGNKQYKTAISFEDIEDEIRDEIIQYTLRYQRDIIKKQRNKREQNV